MYAVQREIRAAGSRGSRFSSRSSRLTSCWICQSSCLNVCRRPLDLRCRLGHWLWAQLRLNSWPSRVNKHSFVPEVSRVPPRWQWLHAWS